MFPLPPAVPNPGLLTADQRKLIDAWIKAHWKPDTPCPVCGSVNWAVGDHVIEMRPFSGGSLTLGGTIYPYFGIMSVPCGHTILINAIVAGVISSNGEVKTEDPNSPEADKNV